MPYGIIKVDTITFTDGGADKTVSISGLVQNPTFSGNITVTGTISGNVIRGGTTVSGATVTGTAGQFGTLTGNTAGFTTITGATVTGTVAQFTTITGGTAGFTTVTGATVTGTTANFTTLSGTTVTGNTGSFTTVTGGVATITSGVFAVGAEALPSISFASDPNTGIYSPGADQVAISTGGSQRVTVDSNGNLGVGIASIPNYNVNLRTVSFNNTNGVVHDYAVGGTRTGSLVCQSTGFEVSTQAAIPLIFSTNSAEKMRITSAGLVGVGTSSPDDPLHVVGRIKNVVNATYNIITSYGFAFRNATTTAKMLWGGYDNTADVGFIQATHEGVAHKNLLINPNGGNVGIGVTSPNELLHVNGNIKVEWGAYRVATVFDNSFRQGMAFDSTNRQLRIFSTTSDSGGSIGFYTRNAAGSSDTDYGTERARIDSSGRLLVGTSSSINNVYVGGASYQSPFQVIGNAAGYGNGLTSLNYSSGGYGATLTLGSSKNATVGVNGALANADDLGIINFVGNDGTNFRTGAYIIATVDGTPSTADLPTRLSFWTAADGTVAPTERMRITNGGITSTFTTAGNASLWVANGSAAGTSVQLIYGTHSAGGVIGGTNSFTVWTNGNVQNTNGSYTTLSDAKLKENIVDAGSQWDDVKAVRIRKWNFKAETGHETHRQIGPIAQELETVCPGLVFETPDRDADGNETGEVTKGVNQSVLYMKAVKALQEAMERIEQLEAKVAALESA